MTYDELWRRLTAVYDEGEAKAIVRMVLDVRFGMSAADIYCGKVTQLSANDASELQKIMLRLQQAEPVQYVIGEAYFAGNSFYVNGDVLIPRPETEQLCTIVEGCAPRHASILDVGTGSGCIAITIALKREDADVEAWEISDGAIAVARRNAERLKAKVKIRRQDALNVPDDSLRWDVIASNPPYICQKEKADMMANVLRYEPHTALFVPDDDPLLFYRAIARYAVKALKDGGKLCFEINPLYADELKAMLSGGGFSHVTVHDDCFGKQRFVVAERE
jgi:release factor glutamine methyltransferase